VRKILVLVAILCITLFSFGTSQAATSSLSDLPGGAGVGYWSCDGGGVSLISLSNVTNVLCGDTAVVVHLSFYDRDSNKRKDFPIPLSPRDTWAAALTCSGNTVTITPNLPQGGWLVGGAYKGSETQTFVNPNAVPTHGYYTATVSRVDSTQFGALSLCGFLWGGNGDGDPRNDPLFSNIDLFVPNLIYMRNAFVSLGALDAYGINGWMMQGFWNEAQLSEVAFGEFFDSVFDFLCPGGLVDWNNNGFVNNVFAGTDDGNGLNIDPWELYTTDNLATAVVANLCNRAGRQRAFGAGFDASFINPAQGIYWGRYNCDPVAGTQTSIIPVFPANSPTSTPAWAPADDRYITMLTCDDEEGCPSVDYPPYEAHPILLGQAVPPADVLVPAPAGEVRIATAAPMMGFMLTTGPNFADVYPLVRENAAIYVQNFTPYPYLFGISEIYYIGNVF
jgi:hypothetical protein